MSIFPELQTEVFDEDVVKGQTLTHLYFCDRGGLKAVPPQPKVHVVTFVDLEFDPIVQMNHQLETQTDYAPDDYHGSRKEITFQQGTQLHCIVFHLHRKMY